MSQRIAGLLQAAGQKARSVGSFYVDEKHLSPEDLDELSDDALSFLRSRQGKPSDVAGWMQVRAMDAGLLPYWASLVGWSSEDERKRFRPLRKKVYDRLEERGEIVKPPGQGQSIEVSPARSSRPSLQDRLLEVVERAEAATGTMVADYRELLRANSPEAALDAVLQAGTTPATTKRLHELGRLDLSLEVAALGWHDVSAASRGAAKDRLDYWRSE